MNAARFVGALVLAAAVIPAAAAAASAAPATPYADQVAIGTAVKIGNPAAGAVRHGAPAAVSTTPASDSTPSGAVVIETESHQAADASDTAVAVLGTKVGSKTGTDELASTGPSRVSTEALLAFVLIGLGLLLRGGPRLVASVRHTAARRH